jgi:hypothetical protein
MKKISFLRLALATAGFWLATSSLTHAQAPGTGGPTPQPAAVPLDGGASLLVATGIGLGWRKLRSLRRTA